MKPRKSKGRIPMEQKWEVNNLAEKVLDRWREEKTDIQQVMVIEEHFEKIKTVLHKILNEKKTFKDYKDLKEWLFREFQEENKHE